MYGYCGLSFNSRCSGQWLESSSSLKSRARVLQNAEWRSCLKNIHQKMYRTCCGRKKDPLLLFFIFNCSSFRHSRGCGKDIRLFFFCPFLKFCLTRTALVGKAMMFLLNIQEVAEEDEIPRPFSKKNCQLTKFSRCRLFSYVFLLINSKHSSQLAEFLFWVRKFGSSSLS